MYFSPTLPHMNRLHLQSFFILFSCTALIYSPALLHDYAYRDDYNQLYRIITEHYRFPSNVLVEGRPLYWLFITILYPLLENFRDFTYLRFMNITLISVLAYQLSILLTRHNLPYWQSLSIALITVTAPGFGVIAGWAGTFQIICGAICGLYAGSYCLTHLALPLRAHARPIIVAGLWLISALCFYQMSAMFFFYPLLLHSILSQDKKDILRKSVLFFIFFAIICAVYLIIYKSCVYLFVDNTLYDYQLDRIRFIFAPIDKLLWFVSGPLYDSLHLTWIGSHPAIAISVGLIIITALYRSSSKQITLTCIKLIYLGGICTVCYAPVWFVAENNGEYRLQLVISSMVSVLFGLGLTAFFTKKYQTTFLALIAIALVALAHIQFQQHFITPQLQLIERTQQQLDSITLTDDTHLHYSTHYPAPTRHEYGNLWVNPNGFLHLIAWKGRDSYPHFTTSPQSSPTTTSPIISIGKAIP